MVKTQRSFAVVYSDYLLVDESIRFIGGQIDKAVEEFDKLVEKSPESEQFQKVCGQISSLYNKSVFESRKLNELGDELREFGVPIPKYD